MMRRALLVLGSIGAAACLIPPLDQLGPGACDLDAGHLCVVGTCVAGVCVTDTASGGGGSAVGGGAAGGGTPTGGGSAMGGGGTSSDGGVGLRVFVTRGSYFGNLSTEGAQALGSIGADALCTLSARAGGKGGTWMAFVPGSTPPRTRFTASGPWAQQQMDGGFVATFTVLTQGNPTTPIETDEEGGLQGTSNVWTGVTSAGDAAASTCTLFTTQSQMGTYGITSTATGGWTQTGEASCSTLGRLYCFEQNPDPTAPIEQGGARALFITSLDFDGTFGGIDGGDLRCQAAATDAGLPGSYLAWLSAPLTDATDRFHDGPPWYQQYADGGSTMAFRNVAALSTAPRVALSADEHGNDLGFTAYWTATLPGGRASGSDCAGFSTTMGNATIGDGLTTGAWTAAGAPTPCSQRWHLLCLQQ
jgi:hypothetical protein